MPLNALDGLCSHCLTCSLHIVHGDTNSRMAGTTTSCRLDFLRSNLNCMNSSSTSQVVQSLRVKMSSADVAAELSINAIFECSDLGVHIDGFIAVQATTVIISSAGDQPISGRPADLLACTNYCFEAALRLIRPGNHVRDVSGPLQKIAESFGCTLVEGVMTHNMKQFVIDGNKCVLNRPAADQRVDDAEFVENEVYAIDIVVSTGAKQTVGCWFVCVVSLTALLDTGAPS